jgi:RNA polymerase sigma-70 factor (ECF subfamily)
MTMTMTVATAADGLLGSQVADAFRANERYVWGLCYRMTGSAADADDLVQETFTRALARPPANRDDPWRPWLVRVAMNLAHDALRRRRRRRYVGPWLPSPIETDDEEPPAHEPVVIGSDGRPLTTEGRYDLMESVSFAFLLALEALTARQRAVLLLRDVFDYSVEDAAAALAMTPSNVKTTHHRARQAMAGYERSRVPRSTARGQDTREMLGRFLSALRDDEPRTVEELLAADVRALSDGAGEFHAARVPIAGMEKVARFFRKLTRLNIDRATTRIAVLNGQPAFIVDLDQPAPGQPPRFITLIDLDATNKVRRIYSVLATRKLTAIR